MDKNFKLTIEYDGTGFHGWQRQKNDRTIQGEIEAALATIIGRRVTLIGSGRTDAGVHALGQVANFHCETDLTTGVFLKGLNSLLPEDIVIRSCTEVDGSFHARFDAVGKTYRYRILNRQIRSAIDCRYAWFVRKKLQLEPMCAAVSQIVGTHDFKSFEGSGSPRSSTIRRVMRADLQEKKNDYIVFDIEAEGFLRFMVRNLVGTLVAVGQGHITPADFHRIQLAKNRDLAGATAPPHGLFLMRVTYETRA